MPIPKRRHRWKTVFSPRPYTFQISGALAAASDVVIPMRVHDTASIRCIYGYVQTPTTDGQSAYLVKYSTDDGATWHPLEHMGIAQHLPDGYKNTYDALVGAGYGKPATRRLPYNDFGIVLTQSVTAGGGSQTVFIASYGAGNLGLDIGEFVHIGLGGSDEEYVQVLAANPAAQTFAAIFTKNHSTGAAVRPTIWPTPLLNEGDTLAFDILAVASPDPGSDLIVTNPSIMAKPLFPLENPGIVSIPLGFLGAVIRTSLTPRDTAAEHKFIELEVRANTGLGAETAPTR